MSATLFAQGWSHSGLNVSYFRSPERLFANYSQWISPFDARTFLLPDMSSTTPSRTSAPTFSSSASAMPATKNDARIMIVGIILGVVAVLVIGGIIYVTMRLKRRQSNTEGLGPFHGTVIDRDHPAAKIMPFGSASRVSPRYRTLIRSCIHSLKPNFDFL